MAFFSFYFGCLCALLSFIISFAQSDGTFLYRVLGSAAVCGIIILLFSGQLLLIAFIELLMYGKCEITKQPHNWARRVVFQLEK